MSDKPTIFEIFASVKRETRAVGKDSRNEQQNFAFRGADAVVNAAAPALDKYGVIIAPHVDKVTYGTVEVGQRRTPMAHVQVEVTYTFYGPAGDSFPVTVPGEAMDSGDKGTAKAMTVAYRIALLQALNLPTRDADPDSETYERSDDTASLSSEDPWLPRIEGVRTQEEAGEVLGELRRLVMAGELTRGRGEQVKKLLDARVEQIRAAQRRAGAQDAAAERPAPGGDDDPEAQFVRRFVARTADADETACRSMRIELGKAVSAKVISPEVANELGQGVTERMAQLRSAA